MMVHSIDIFKRHIAHLDVEQVAMVVKVNSLMDLCETKEKEIKQNTRHIEQFMQSCLREVFEGEKEEIEEDIRIAAEPKQKYGFSESLHDRD